MRLHQDSERRARCRAPLALAMLAVLCACSTTTAGGDFPDVRERHRAAVRVSEVAVSEESANFSFIHHIDVDSRGQIYVCDFYAPFVTILGPDGRRVGTLGRKGNGPGEFRVATSVQVLPGDSVLLYDGQLARVTIFGPGSTEPAETQNLAPGLNGRAPRMLRRRSDGSGFLAVFRPVFRFGYGDDFSKHRDHVRLLQPDGSRMAEVDSFPSAGTLVVSTSIAPNPFGKSVQARLDSRDRVVVLWTDTLALSIHDSQGQRVGGFRTAYVPPPVEAADVAWAAKQLPAGPGSGFELALRDSVPERWPAASGLLLDDRDRIWISAAGRSDLAVEWLRFSTEGEYLGSVLLDPGTRLYAVRDGLLYAERKEEDDTPRVVVLRPRRPLP